MTKLEFRPWVPQHAETYVQSLASRFAAQEADALERELLALVDENRTIHERDCVNLNPATNVMNPKAEALLACRHRRAPLARLSRRQVRDGAGGHREDRGDGGRACGASVRRALRRDPGRLGRTRQSLCLHGDGQAGRHHHRTAVEHRRPCHPSRRRRRWLAMAFTRIPHRSIPPPTPSMSTRCAPMHGASSPKLITIGGSLNLFPHPIREIRAIADEVGARVLFDAAHMSGMIAGHAWQQPLEEGAHVMTMSTYKSLGGPASGLIVTNDAGIAQNARRHRLSWSDRQFRRGQIGGTRHDPARLEGARPRLCRRHGRDGPRAGRGACTQREYRCSPATGA